MKSRYKLLTLATLLAATQAHATDGYITHGYGVKSQGAGGVGYALPQDTLTVASNPAGLAWIGNRIDIGATWFRPIRDAEITGARPISGTYDANDQKNFIIPEFGYSKQVSPELSLGVAVYGNGGLNTNYDRAVPLLGSSQAKVDLIQLFVAPTIAWKITPTQSVGVTLNLAYQRFAAKGLENFATPASQSPNDVTNKGLDQCAGYNHSNQPIPNSETYFNILAPAVVQDHLTFSSTWTFENKSELSFSYLHAFENTVDGKNSVPGSPAEVNLKMRQDAVGVAYSWAL